MKLLIATTILLMTAFAQAKKAKVLIVDPDIETKDLQKDYDLQKPVSHDVLPKKEQRDEVLAGIGSVKAYDELQKDLLFMDLKSKSFPELQKKYPDIPVTDFKSMLARRKR